MEHFYFICYSYRMNELWIIFIAIVNYFEYNIIKCLGRKKLN